MWAICWQAHVKPKCYSKPLDSLQQNPLCSSKVNSKEKWRENRCFFFRNLLTTTAVEILLVDESKKWLFINLVIIFFLLTLLSCCSQHMITCITMGSFVIKRNVTTKGCFWQCKPCIVWHLMSCIGVQPKILHLKYYSTKFY